MCAIDFHESIDTGSGTLSTLCILPDCFSQEPCELSIIIPPNL